MLKNAIIYRILPHQPGFTVGQAEDALARQPFVACGPTQEYSCGWTPPRRVEHGALVETVGQHWVMRFRSEEKKIPADVLKRKVKEKAERILQETGRRPGKKESKELKEEARLDLLPMAFSREAETLVWMDPVGRFLTIDTASQSRADDIVTTLVESLPGLSLALLDTKTSPQAAMSQWLLEQEPPAGFTVDRDCELQSNDESKAKVRYVRHPLDTTEVEDHIRAGKLPVLLALTWDDRVSFVLTAGLQLRSIQFLDSVFESQGADAASGFDADVTIMTGELAELIPDLLTALGGEARA